MGDDTTRASLLLRLKQNGSMREVAWTEFDRIYRPIISGFARRMGARQQQIDDLVQDVLKGFFSAVPEFEYSPARGRFRGYLKTCVCNKLRKIRRGEALIPTSSSDGVEASVDAIWEDVWETQKLRRAVEVVRRRYSVNEARRRTFCAFEMCTIMDRSTEDVAGELKITNESVRAAKTRVSRAVRQAMDSLDELAD